MNRSGCYPERGVLISALAAAGARRVEAEEAIARWELDAWEVAKEQDDDRDDRRDRQAGSSDMVGTAEGPPLAVVASVPGESAHPLAKAGHASAPPRDASVSALVEAGPTAVACIRHGATS